MVHDAAWKRLFGLPVLVEHLLGGFAIPLAERLDSSTLRQLSADSVDADAKRLRGDAAWRVGFNDATGRSLVLLLEFQSMVDRLMDARMRGYADAARERLRRQRKTDADGEDRLLPVWTSTSSILGTGTHADSVPEFVIVGRGMANLSSHRSLEIAGVGHRWPEAFSSNRSVRRR